MLTKPLIFLIRCYQKIVSPLKTMPCCRFTPTCSEYAVQALAEWGLIRGLALSIWRVLRCNPFCRGGRDDVPVNVKRRARLAKRSRCKEAQEREKVARNKDSRLSV